jgi:hypothetical protein
MKLIILLWDGNKLVNEIKEMQNGYMWNDKIFPRT